METGRKHLSQEILRIVDNTFPYEEMRVGQTLRIWAEDAIERKSSFFNVVVLHTSKNTNGQTSVAFEFVQGDFNFNTDGPLRTRKLKPGTLMKGGISANLVPQPNYKMVYVGGIGIGRDHSFEFVDGETTSIIAHNIEAIEVTEPSRYFQPPDITDYLEKARLTEYKQTEARRSATEESNKAVKSLLEEKFGHNPMLPEIRKIIDSLSPNGKIVVLSFLMYAQEDGVFEKAYGLLKEVCKEHYRYQHPYVAGDPDFHDNAKILMRMTLEAGIAWPRPYAKEIVVVGESILLPTTPERVDQLQKKLEEYKSRVNDSARELNSQVDARHKAFVLERLLKEKKIVVSTLMEKIKRESWFNNEDLENALAVISDYCKTGGRNIAGGTGLA